MSQIEVYESRFVQTIINCVLNEFSILSAYNAYYKSAPTPEKIYTYRILCNYYLNQGGIKVVGYYRRKQHRAIVDYIDTINLVGLSLLDQKEIIDVFWYHFEKQIDSIRKHENLFYVIRNIICIRSLLFGISLNLYLKTTIF